MEGNVKSLLASLALVMWCGEVGASVEFPIPDSVRTWEASEYATNGIRAVWIENVPWNGKATRVFAYYALPEGASVRNKVPGIVLVHGGGGTAFHDWVGKWTARGYAAISMDTCGGLPVDGEFSMCHARHEWSGPNGWGCFADETLKPENQWMYHAVEAVVRSHTFLRSLPEVDASKIGVTGISWGGVLTSVACGVDSRFAFAAPVYGCGNLRNHSLWSSEIGERWSQLWDPVQYVRQCRIPTLWCTGTNDHFFPLDSLAETVLATGNALLSIKVRMRHGQKEGDVPEIRAFADSIVKGAPKLSERNVIRREWIYTDSAEQNWEKRCFHVSSQCPKYGTIRFENMVTEDGLILSSVPAFSTAKERPEELVDCPVSENFQGKENISWSKAYAYSQTDEMKDLPRVLLIGDSICNGYQDRVRQLLRGKMNVTYWASSYCVLHPGYTWLLSFYLSENEYDVIHINNGLHSLYAQPDEWGRALKSVMEQIRRCQPNAKLVWASSTPLADSAKTEKVKILNAVAAKVVAGMPGVGTDDLFSLMDQLDRGRFWSDAYHFKRPGVEMLAKQVAACSLRMAGLSDGALSARGVVVNGKVIDEAEWRYETDGCAVRYRLPNDKRMISGEDTVWTMPEDARCWYQVQAGAYEKPYVASKVGDVPKGKTLSLPITFKLADGSYRLITEANLVDYTDLGVVYEGEGRFRAVYHAEKGPFEQAGANTTPWRVMIKARNLDELYNCDLVRRLCPEPTNERSIALHRPGRCIWQWLPAGDPVYAEQKEWYDKTAALGFEYYLIDDGWKKWRDGGKDQWACLKSVIDYGKSVGVKSAMWVDSKEMPTAGKRRAYLKKVVEAGAVGIKIDFIPPCDSKWCKWYEETLADTAELGLFVDFHGAVKPTGREKTWPHEMAREAVRGHEWHITRYKRVLPLEHDTILPFCRMVQGHADYTPLVLQKDQLVHFTWARETAQAVVMSAPFLCLGDFPQNYIDSPMTELIRALPAEYEQSVVLPGSEIGECVAVARYSKGKWFVAVENGSQARHLKIPLSFLGKGSWRLLGFRDAPDGRLDDCRREDRTVNALDVIELDVRPGGGYVAMLQEAAEPWNLFERRLGMFIHWGIYAVGGLHEQEQLRYGRTREEYNRRMSGFSAEKFSAEHFVDVAESAGAEYIVITTKHHDGFCMWNTKTTDFNVMNTPAKRDVIGELAEACKRRGMKLGFYFSNPDWHQPFARNDKSTHQLPLQPGDVPDKGRYIEYVKSQVTELLSNYGEIVCFFWDIPAGIELPEMDELVRRLQPNIMINDRGWGNKKTCDYSTPERDYKWALGNRHIEACDAVGVHSWGYRINEDYRTLGYLSRNIDRYLATGGNYLLNVGPKADGTIPEEAIACMSSVGRWYGRARESYQGVETVTNLTNASEIMVTRRGEYVYLHFRKPLLSTGVFLPKFDRPPKEAIVLNTGEKLSSVVEMAPWTWNTSKSKPSLHLMGIPADDLANEAVVIRLRY